MSDPKNHPDKTITLTNEQTVILLNSLSDTEDGIFGDEVEEDLSEFDQQLLGEIKVIREML